MTVCSGSEPPERDEAGSPMSAGAVAMAAAAAKLLEIGMETVATLRPVDGKRVERMKSIEGLHFLGDADPVMPVKGSA